MNKFEEVKFIKTNEDWYPSFPPRNNCPEYKKWDYINPNTLDHMAIEVKLLHIHSGCRMCFENYWGVLVSGADDDWLRIYDISYEEDKHLYENIKDFVTKEKLMIMGLSYQ